MVCGGSSGGGHWLRGGSRGGAVLSQIVKAQVC